MTQYLLSVHTSETDEAAMSEDLIQRLYQQVDDFNEKVRAAGAWVFAGGLEPIEAATTARSPSPRSTSAASGSSRRPTSTPP
jgi:hypothetical protein